MSLFRKRSFLPEQRLPSPAAAVTCLADGALGYQLFLGRQPESEAVAQSFIGLSVKEMARTFFSSKEFVGRILEPVAIAGEPLEWQGNLAPEALEAPLTAALALDRALMEQAQRWDETFGGLLQSRPVREVLVALHGELAMPLIDRSKAAVEALKAAMVGQAEALKRLKVLADGLIVTAAHGLVAEGPAGFRSISDDPSFSAQPSVLASDAHQLSKLLIGLRRRTERPFRVKVYLDLGRGFSEATTVETLTVGRSDVVFVLLNTKELQRIRVDPMESDGSFMIERLVLEPLTNSSDTNDLIDQSVENKTEGYYRRRWARRLMRNLGDGPMELDDAVQLSRKLTLCCATSAVNGDYQAWLERYERPDFADYARMSEMMAAFAVKPRFSVLVPTYNAPADLLDECVRSVLDQSYPHFDICIAGDGSSDGDLLGRLDHLAPDSRVHVARGSHGIDPAGPLHSGPDTIGGDYVVLLDPYDVLPDYALFVLAEAINRQPLASVLYAYKDMIDDFGERFAPPGKPASEGGCSFGRDQAGQLGVYKAALVREVGGWQGDQDTGAASLGERCRAAAGQGALAYLPHVLCHRRPRNNADDDHARAASSNLELAWPPPRAMPWLDVPGAQ